MHEYEVLIRATMTDFIKVKIKADSIIAAEDIARKMIRTGEGSRLTIDHGCCG
jgi:hypothetical protein